jgi:30S ribosomal protein S31
MIADSRDRCLAARALCRGSIAVPCKIGLTATRILTIVPRAYGKSNHERDTMGKGDKKTRRGKIFKGSYGKSRQHFPAKKAVVKRTGKKG